MSWPDAGLQYRMFTSRLLKLCNMSLKAALAVSSVDSVGRLKAALSHTDQQDHCRCYLCSTFNSNSNVEQSAEQKYQITHIVY